MPQTVIKVENLSKQYRLGLIGTGTLSHDLNRWWHKVRGKEDPYLKVGEVNDQTSQSNSGYIWALNDINLEIKQGDVIGIIGKNGAGKSTLLKILSRVTGPTTGFVGIKGRTASLLEVGTGFHPELTGQDNIYLNGAILGMTKREIKRKLNDIIDFSGCSKYIDTPVKRYSSGMKVRLGFAVAAFLDPEILIVDEVLAVGDAEFQRRAIGKMNEVSYGGGRTVLFVSHNMASIQALCSKAVLLSNGTIKVLGNTDEVILQYLAANSLQSDIELTKRLDRKGKGNLKIVQIDFRSAGKSESSDIIQTGDDVEFIIHFHFNNNQSVSNFRFSLAFKDSFDNTILLLSTKFSDLEIANIKGKDHIVCKLSKLPLVSGTYTLDVWGKINGQLEDKVENAASVTIHPGDFYGNGKLPANTRIQILVDQKWNL